MGSTDRPICVHYQASQGRIMSMDIVFGILAVVLLIWIWDWDKDDNDITLV